METADQIVELIQQIIASNLIDLLRNVLGN